MSLEATATAAVATAAATVRWWVEKRRQAARMRALSQANDDPHGARTLSHLSPSLARLVEQTRLLRLQLETPLLRFSPALGDTPWGRRERFAEYDNALCDARRALWEWMHLFKRLGRSDLEYLYGLGLSLRPFRYVLLKQGVFDRSDDPWQQMLFPPAPDLNLVFEELKKIMHELKRFEFALLGWRLDPYRGS